MKAIVTIILLAAATFSALAGETNSRPVLRVGEYVKLPGAEGFLKYSGEHSGVMVCGLSSDIGSAVPSEDFRLYAKHRNTYRLVLSLPMLTRKGYSCIVRGDSLNVYVTSSYQHNPSTRDGNPVVVIDLQQIVEAHAEPDGAANRIQPIRAETNRTSAAAGSDR